MKIKFSLIPAIFALTIPTLTPVAMASGDHAGGHDHETPKAEHSHDAGHNDHAMSGEKNNTFLKMKKIDGYDVSFHVMDAKDGMKMGDESHHFMVKVEENGKELDNIKINSKIVYPNSQAESKMLMKMGGWYMAGYNLENQGKYQMMILFKTADGKKHSGGVYYSK